MQVGQILDRLAACKRSGLRVGVITDIDGTISPIAPTPAASVVSPRSLEALTQLCDQVTLVAAITGRAAQDAHRKVGLDCMIYVGNHGFERWQNGQLVVTPAGLEAQSAVQAVADALEPNLLSGMLIENKGATLSVHYRLAPDPEAVRLAMLPLVEALAHEHGLLMFTGRMIFEIRPAAQIDKGTAFRALIIDHALDAAVFLGDDTTDADALIVARQLREANTCEAYGIGVDSGFPNETPFVVYNSADALVPGVAGVEEWLESLVNAFKTP